MQTRRSVIYVKYLSLTTLHDRHYTAVLYYVLMLHFINSKMAMKNHTLLQTWPNPTHVTLQHGRKWNTRLIVGSSEQSTATLMDIRRQHSTQPCRWYRPPDVQRSATVPSQWHRHVHGTACRRRSGMHRRWRRSVASWRLYFSGRRLTMTRRSWLYCTV